MTKNMFKPTKGARTVLAIILLVLCVIYMRNVQVVHIDEEDIRIDGIHFPLLYERVDAELFTPAEDPIFIELKTTMLSKSTYYEDGNSSSFAKLHCWSDEFSVKTSSLKEDGTWEVISEDIKPRSEIGSDFYSPLLNYSSEGYAANRGIRLNTEFGLYEIH